MEDRLNRVRRQLNAHDISDCLIDEIISLLDSIQLLPDPLQRIVITGYYFCRFTEKQIAEDCRLSRKTVYRVKRSAVKALGEMHG